MEFDAAHSRGQLGPYAVALRKAFQAFDAEKKGFIELIEIKALLSAEAASTVAMLISRVDPDNDGRISFDTFFNAMTSGLFVLYL
jgi:Ca2+-binding EF-hand superfamily protein